MNDDLDIPKNRKELPEYRTWMGMNNRCANEGNQEYHNYGGRGIKVCEEWQHDFPAFYRYVGKKPEPQGDYSLDRIDNDGNYEPGNVRWTTRFVQAKNRRLHKDNKSGASGITWSDKKNGWSVFYFHHHKSDYVGFYPTLGRAIEALVEYRVKMECRQEAERVIGKDEPYEEIDGVPEWMVVTLSENNVKRGTRNKLRAEQRAELQSPQEGTE